MFQRKVVEKIKTHILWSNFFYKRAVYEIIWKNTEQLDRSHIIFWCKRNACRIPKATSTHSECVINIAFPLQQWLHNGMLYFVYCLSCPVQKRPETQEQITFVCEGTPIQHPIQPSNLRGVKWHYISRQFHSSLFSFVEARIKLYTSNMQSWCSTGWWKPKLISADDF
jgi:hypothetical protein